MAARATCLDMCKYAYLDDIIREENFEELLVETVSHRHTHREVVITSCPLFNRHISPRIAWFSLKIGKRSGYSLTPNINQDHGEKRENIDFVPCAAKLHGGSRSSFRRIGC